jgi:hypothetical protein
MPHSLYQVAGRPLEPPRVLAGCWMKLSRGASVRGYQAARVGLRFCGDTQMVRTKGVYT